MNHTRCRWCNLNNPLYITYHDNEWGMPQHDDRMLFEMLVLEFFQAGLSWETVLNKRENFRRAFDNFDPILVKEYDCGKIKSLAEDPGIVRNRQKIEAAIVNARIFLSIQQEWGSFDRYIWHYTSDKILFESGLSVSPLSDAVSADLKKRGMKFVGSTVIYSYLQAIGVIYSHDQTCFLYRTPKK